MEKGYFVVTLIYRILLGLLIASMNAYDLTTMFAVGVSLFFLMYNLVNLPFLKAYNNYRANVCHITQFVILFVAMYYRSMKSSASFKDVGNIYAPAVIEIVCLVVAVVVSAIALAYDIYLFVKGIIGEFNKVEPNIDGKEQLERIKRNKQDKSVDELSNHHANDHLSFTDENTPPGKNTASPQFDLDLYY